MTERLEIGAVLLRIIVLGLRGDEAAARVALEEIESLRPVDGTDPGAWADIWRLLAE